MLFFCFVLKRQFQLKASFKRVFDGSWDWQMKDYGFYSHLVSNSNPAFLDKDWNLPSDDYLRSTSLLWPREYVPTSQSLPVTVVPLYNIPEQFTRAGTLRFPG